MGPLLSMMLKPMSLGIVLCCVVLERFDGLPNAPVFKMVSHADDQLGLAPADLIVVVVAVLYC